MRRSLATALAVGVMVLTPALALAEKSANDKAVASQGAADRAAAEKANLDKIVHSDAPATADAKAAPVTAPSAVAPVAPPPAPINTDGAADKPGEPLNLRPAHTIETASPAPSIGLGTKIALAALIGGAAYFVYRRKTTAKVSKPSALRVTARASIGTRTEVCIVEVDGQRLLIGVTPSSIRTLTALTDEPMIEQTETAPSPVEENLARLFASAKREVMNDAQHDDEPEENLSQRHAQPIETRSISSFRATRSAVSPEPLRARSNTQAPRLETLKAAAPAVAKKSQARKATSTMEGQISGLLAARGSRS